MKTQTSSTDHETSLSLTSSSLTNPPQENLVSSTVDYKTLLEESVTVINRGRQTATLRLNSELAETYWELGKILSQRKFESKHGSAVVRRLSVDLKILFPQLGLSPRNLWYMKGFYERFVNSEAKVQRCVALLPWGQIITILNSGLDDEATTYYANQSLQKSWSRDMLVAALKLDMYANRKPVEHNFSSSLPAAQAQEAIEVFRESYNLGFLGLDEPVRELELEKRLVEKIKFFLLELGKGFTYIGNQYVLRLNEQEYKVDLLFFHRKLKCLVAVDLKIGEFQPEYVGKMNFYLSLLDKEEKGDDENASIGIILCANKDKMKVKLSLQDVSKPIGVADYQAFIPHKELESVIIDEIASFNREIEYKTSEQRGNEDRK